MYCKQTAKCAAFLLLLFLSFGMFQAVAAAPEPTQSAPSNLSRPVQLFDVKAGKVIKSMPNDEQFQTMARGFLSTVTGLAPQIAPDKNCSYVYRIPLNESYALKVGELSIQTNDVFIFYCQNSKPIILCFNEQRKPFVLEFQSDLTPLLIKLKNV